MARTIADRALAGGYALLDSFIEAAESAKAVREAEGLTDWYYEAFLLKVAGPMLLQAAMALDQGVPPEALKSKGVKE